MWNCEAVVRDGHEQGPTIYDVVFYTLIKLRYLYIYIVSFVEYSRKLLPKESLRLIKMATLTLSTVLVVVM